MFNNKRNSASLYDSKRRYLQQLPPPQVIEICLLFELHVPLYVKNWVWPEHVKTGVPDAQQGQPSPEGTPQKNEKKTEPVMDALVQPSQDASKTDSNASETAEKDKETPSKEGDTTTTDPKPPEKENDKPTETPAPSTSTATTTVSTPTATPAPVPPAPVPLPRPINGPLSVVPSYPHQPYGYQSYPHASYYPHVWSHYPHMPYAMPHPPPPTASTSYQPPPIPAYSTAPTFTTTPAAPAPQPAPDPPPPHPRDDDLPSYEDMIVEALIDSGDTDGIAPKDIYAWMQTHYPVQSNFRPSASQALQKAYKRGRFEKNNTGKYRMNPHYTGNGSITRKPTRRPQTVAPQPSTNVTAQSTRSSPFTRAPLNRTTKPPFAGLGQFGPSIPPPYGVPAPQPPPPRLIPEPESTNDIGDAYEAAQHILKTINFGEGLLNLKSPEPDSREDAEQGDKEWEDGIRAQLQAQLALLAAQLQEYAQERDAEEAALQAAAQLPPPPPPQPPRQQVQPARLVAVPPVAAMEVDDDEDDDEDDDMDEVIIP
ncbi:hypothetical protein BDZ89DRAFT_1050793 [Hymenopellis radicata]|nr:hypothetical protein BDZ89DRAFT_1050793 [Hymenopellis radicata]